MAEPTYSDEEITNLLLDGSDEALDEVHADLNNRRTLSVDQLGILAGNPSERAAALRSYNARLSQIQDLVEGPKFDTDGHHVDPSGSSAVRNSVGRTGRLSIDELLEKADERSMGELAGRIGRGDAPDLTNDHIRTLEQMDRELTAGVFEAMQPKAPVRTEPSEVVTIWTSGR